MAITLNSSTAQVEAAVLGYGIAYEQENLVERHIAASALIQVLDGWCPMFWATISTTRAGGRIPPPCVDYEWFASSRNSASAGCHNRQRWSIDPALTYVLSS